MGQGHLELGGSVWRDKEAIAPDSSPPGKIARYRVLGLFLLTTLFVAVKVVGHDYWAVAFGLAMSGLLLLTPESPGHSEPWRQHALRVVSACFVVVTLASVWTTLAGVR